MYLAEFDIKRKLFLVLQITRTLPRVDIPWETHFWHTLSDTFSLSDTRFQNSNRFFSWTMEDLHFFALEINNLNITLWNFPLVAHFFTPKIVSLRENLMQFFPQWYTFGRKSVSLRENFKRWCLSYLH